MNFRFEYHMRSRVFVVSVSVLIMLWVVFGLGFVLKVCLGLVLGYVGMGLAYSFMPSTLELLRPLLESISNVAAAVRMRLMRNMPYLPLHPLSRMKIWGSIAGMFLVFGLTSHGVVSFLLILAGLYATSSAVLNGARDLKQLADQGSPPARPLDIDIRI